MCKQMSNVLDCNTCNLFTVLKQPIELNYSYEIEMFENM